MKKTIRDYEYCGKKVLLRCDLNVPVTNGKITDDTRIRESLTSINYLINEGGKVIILSHLGKVKGENDKLDNSLYPVYLRLKELLDTNVYFCEETRGAELENKIDSLENGDVLLIENTRFEDIVLKKESNCDEELSKYWASLGDIFINDAYGTCHRKHSSNVGIGMRLPNGIGFLIEKEIIKLEGIMNENTHPFIVILGGKKISDKTLVIDNLVNKCDKILIGGGMCFTFLKALNVNVGSSIVDDDNLDFCRNILSRYGEKIVLPVDIVTKDGINKDINQISDLDVGFDIGFKTIDLFKKELNNCKRVIVNGPMGVFEDSKFSNGTNEIYKFLDKNKIKTLIGGGDSASSVKLLGYSNSFYHISTGGGATLEYLGGKSLPGLDVIEEKE